MFHCPLRRAAFIGPLPHIPSRPSSRTGSTARRSRLTAIGARVPGVAAWHRIAQLLASIPDSNDDFGLL